MALELAAMEQGGRIVLAGRAGAQIVEGRVVAAFARSFYVAASESEVACAGGPDIGAGPLNIVYAACPTIPALGAWWRFDARTARIWQPDPWPAYDAPASRRAVAQIPRAKGLLAPAARDPFAQAAHAPLAALAQWREGPVPDILENLLGLGPGLTPSGDDALGGAALALRASGRHTQADALRAFVRMRAPTATSAISAAHLRAACDGQGAAALHKILADLVQGRLPDLAPLDRTGHSSGWDAAAGIVAILS
jgi:hypothetical protein